MVPMKIDDYIMPLKVCSNPIDQRGKTACECNMKQLAKGIMLPPPYCICSVFQLREGSQVKNTTGGQGRQINRKIK